MQINGNIQVYSDGKLISKGSNLITNSGKAVFLNWLAHPSYQNATLYTQNRSSQTYSGASLSSQRFVSNLTFTLSGSEQSTDGLSMFQSDSNAVSIKGQTLYISLKQLTNICGMYINCKANNTTYYYANRVKIYYSTDQVAQANLNGTWKLVKISLNSFADASQMSASKMIRFDSIYTTDGYITAKSFKLQFVGCNDHDYRVSLRGVGLLQKIPYPNVPCAIALGTGKNTPLLTDTQLSSHICTLFVNKQLCNYQKVITEEGEEIIGQSSSSDYTESSYNTSHQTTSLVKIDLNNKLPSKTQLDGVTKINVVYVARLNYYQYNNIQFNQIGLFYPSSQAIYESGANTCDTMFSHGLFESAWLKDSTQIVDIKYTISITV